MHPSHCSLLAFCLTFGCFVSIRCIFIYSLPFLSYCLLLLRLLSIIKGSRSYGFNVSNNVGHIDNSKRDLCLSLLLIVILIFPYSVLTFRQFSKNSTWGFMSMYPSYTFLCSSQFELRQPTKFQSLFTVHPVPAL